MGRTASGVIAIAFLCTLQAAPVQAQPTRVFVAAQGSDSNPYTFAQPCRTFQHAVSSFADNSIIDNGTNGTPVGIIALQ
jgi:hypothetical protein